MSLLKRPKPVVLGLGTALPDGDIPQKRLHKFMKRVATRTLDSGVRSKRTKFLDTIYEKSVVDHRYSVIPDYAQQDAQEFEFFPKNWKLEPLPATEQRMEWFEEKSVPLARVASRRALEQAEVSPEEITHLIVNTCTGNFAPGLDVRLMKDLELKSTVKRCLIGFMGCYAGFNGLEVAGGIIGSHPDARVLHVSLELCSLHFQNDFSREGIVTDSLFSDGCAAAVYAPESVTSNGEPIARIKNTHMRTGEQTCDKMTWRIGNHGFKMSLDPEVPEHIQNSIQSFLRELYDEENPSLRSVDGWAVHPGGPTILDAVQKATGFAPEKLKESRQVLRDMGNMSSATIFFVLDRMFSSYPSGSEIVGLGFGPGLTTAGARLEIM